MKKLLTGSMLSASALILIATAGPVAAHHSAAGYDLTKTLSAVATLKEFRWGAPHSMVVVVIKGADGKPQEVSMASASPASLTKQGFKLRDFKRGDKMEVTWHPSKNGAIGGALAIMTLADGRTFYDEEFRPGGLGLQNATEQAESAQVPSGAK
jgi:hypothetical protein